MSFMARELTDGIIPKANVKKRVAIVGGGPGGIQAMQTLLDRGHDVTLYEATDELGGNLIPATLAPFKVDLRDYLTWMRHTAKQCEERGAKILMNTSATKELLDKEHYDALIIAVGASPVIPESIPGIHGKNVAWAPDGETDRFETGKRVVIVGAGSIGVEVALDLHRAGKEVIVIDAQDKDSAFHQLHAAISTGARAFLRIFSEEGIEISYETELIEVRNDSVVIRKTATGVTEIIPCDSVLLATGMRARYEAVDELRHCVPETSVHIIGDCRKAATIAEAVNGAFQACINI